MIKEFPSKSTGMIPTSTAINLLNSMVVEYVPEMEFGGAAEWLRFGMIVGEVNRIFTATA